jgi:hypothetical protein
MVAAMSEMCAWLDVSNADCGEQSRVPCNQYIYPSLAHGIDPESMSFGYSVGDILDVSTLAWSVYKSCKAAPESFGHVASEVLSLQAVLKNRYLLS